MVKKKSSARESKMRHILHSGFWFLVGFLFAAVFLASFILMYFQFSYQNRVIPGVFAGNTYIGEKTKEEIEKIFQEKNESVKERTFTFSYKNLAATTSAEALGIGYDATLIADQALLLGKTPNLFSNLYIILNSYLHGTYLLAPELLQTEKIKEVVQTIQDTIYREPVDALFMVENNKVTAFQQSSDGQTLNYEKLEESVRSTIPSLLTQKDKKTYTLTVPVKILLPQVSTEKANSLGIVEVIGQGTSQFVGSIPNRVHNISLASSRVNGILIAPNETFSFNKNLGDVSKYTGYKEAYVIQNGQTILGDGGGVCQVSTTLFRAILNSGLPILERHPHSYRVGYYEQKSPPGLDATIFVPTEDLKFKNDTGNHILIQNVVDSQNLTITFTLYGKTDNREVQLTNPVITNQLPPPAPLYQDDPTLAKGEEKQVEHEAWGAQVTFKRTVTKGGKVIISETISSRYAPWRAVFLRGTKEG